MEPHRKQLHISLAYQFRAQDKDKLEAQAQGESYLLVSTSDECIV